ncbi:RNA polymerase II transcription mediator complex subunit 9-domain-containing protein [Nemania serpens]|nr:RNA polymerase II transcription mediator complex subunit 9-domain-containing protein [Nemania serpens]
MSQQQQQLPAQAIPLPLPESLNPDALDVLSELAHLLTRLRATTTTTTTTTAAGAPTATTTLSTASAHTATPTPTQPHPTSHATPTPTALLATRRAGAGAGAELTLKEIPLATDALKHRFQRARTHVETALPDLARGLADQEAEVAALEARIARQRDTLGKLREVGARLAMGEREADEERGGEKMDIEE